MRKGELEILSMKLNKKCVSGELSYEDAFNELFFIIHGVRKLPDDFKFKTDNKIIE